MLFRIQGQLDHALQKFVCWQTGKIVANQFLAEQAADVAQLAAFLLAGVYEVPVPVINDNHVLVRFEP